ncbi:MAG TPA: imidazolonepropionase [Gemmatimonadales bacterium]|nr:imidazolonepropionase [Gemmatimonadales bacterium]
MPLLSNIGSLARCLPSDLQAEIHRIPAAALAWEGETIVWVGPEADIPEQVRDWPREDAGGRLVVPGLVDCHTHLAFAGWRAEEFEQRILGRSYLDIAAAGGGIASTVAKTRAATTEALTARCREHLAGMARLGVTTVEAKSGYGLSEEHELRLLGIYRELGAGPQRIVATLLAAHLVPAEYCDRRAEYLELVAGRIVPSAARERLARFCDVFVEEGAFTVAEARAILEAGKRHGLRPKLHADQLSSSGGAELAAEVGAASADHLERVSEEGVRRLARADVVAVSLPFATLYLGASPLPARRLLDAGVRVAVATDFNPGTAPSYHLPMAMTLACTLQRMTPAEVLKGATIVAARAIGLQAEVGSLEAGKSADFAVIDADSVEQWLYHLRANACVRTVARGVELWRAPGAS